MNKNIGKKSVAFLVSSFMVFGAPAMALACNWGSTSKGDCEQVSVTVHISRGKSEKAGSYKLYWAEKGNARKGQVIAEGEIPALNKGRPMKSLTI